MPGVLAIHGLSQTGWIWAPIARRLAGAAGARQVVTMDLRGHGLSDAPTDDGAYDLAVARRRMSWPSPRARGLLAAGRVDGPGVVLAGHGFGAIVAATAAASSATVVRASSWSMAAGSRSRPAPASTSTSSFAASTSRRRSCARCRHSWPTARGSTLPRGTPTRTGQREPRSWRRTPVESSRRPGPMRSRPACARCSRTTRSPTLAAVDAPITALIAADDDDGSRAAPSPACPLPARLPAVGPSSTCRSATTATI